jgi:hypothetical protein
MSVTVKPRAGLGLNKQAWLEKGTLFIITYKSQVLGIKKMIDSSMRWLLACLLRRKGFGRVQRQASAASKFDILKQPLCFIS